MGSQGPFRPTHGPLHRLRYHRTRCRQTHADVEHHGNVGAQHLLGGDGLFRGQLHLGTVVGGPKHGALLGDLRIEGEDLVPAGVGEDRSWPAHEAMDSTHALDQLGTGPKHQVVGVGQHHLRTHPCQVVAVERLDRCPGADGHESGCGHLSAGKAENPSASPSILGCELQAGGVRHVPARSASMASPKLRKRYPRSRAVR